MASRIRPPGHSRTALASHGRSAVGTELPSRDVRLHGESWGISGRAADIAKMARLTQLYGPAVRRKRFSSIWRICGLASMYPASDWSALGHHGYQRACDLITGQASNGPFGSPVFVRAGKTDPPSRLILSQTSAGNRCWVVIDNSSSRTVPLFVPKAGCSFVPADVWTPKHGATLKPIGMSSHLSWRIRTRARC